MQELVSVTGMVLKAEPYGEFDRRVVLLTAQRGKITCFAKNARKPGNRFMAATNPFCFGEYKLFEGRSAYSLNEVEVSNYFETLRNDFEGACYGMYFLEVLDCCTRENNDEKELLKLLYQSVRALSAEGIPNSLIRRVFEIRMLRIQGEYSETENREFLESTRYTLNYITETSFEKLYTFNVSKEVLDELSDFGDLLMGKYIGRDLKSLEILNTL